MQSAVLGAIAENKNKPNGAVLLRTDVENITNHVFGYHDCCRDYFCKRKGSNDINHREELKANSDMCSKILSCVHTLAINVRSLMKIAML